MIERIEKNEKLLDSALLSIKSLNEALDSFESNIKGINSVSKYYTGRNFKKDKDAYESGKIPKIKAGVLSEDAVWNMLDDVDEIIIRMSKIIKKFEDSDK